MATGVLRATASTSELLSLELGVHERDDVTPDARACLEWLRRAVRLAGYTPAKWTEEHDAVALQFVLSAEMRRLVAYMSVDGALILVAPLSLLPVAPKAFQYWIKRDPPAAPSEGGVINGIVGGGGSVLSLPPPLTLATLRSSVAMGYVNGGGVDALLRLVDVVYMPVLQGGAAGTGPAASWPESVRKDFVGQAQRCVRLHPFRVDAENPRVKSGCAHAPHPLSLPTASWRRSRRRTTRCAV